ncbi:hypothetical protein TUMSATVNIG1_60080 (plasmid) [Vibrio nigripulchritudo]|uniref:hypothetical protein n=1 Tax=Vibrio nigripulchritudo TaxID=28173 RepID=UPI00190C01F2|nr:hypothetical protein [Vibrio nigripulchritudo]BCL74022.1 hypothetical protein VNTUMSATTG_59590 [Vibrio nigripulchritudo]BDU35399.1 hypothetical protein TUMSATVNIG1_60080 [Vibrio nigripulchritudo]
MKLFIVGVLSFFVIGCASTNQAPKHLQDEKYISERLEAVLESMAAKAVEAKEITMSHQAAMARLSNGNKNSKNSTPGFRTPKGFDRLYPLNSDFYGHALSPLKSIATLTDYDLQEQGGRSPGILWVSLSSHSDRKAIDVLADISYQIDKYGVDIDVWETPQGPHVGVILVKYPTTR